MDDKKAAGLAARWLKNTQERLDLWKSYHKQISKAVSPIRAAQFLQVEHQMALFIDLNIAAEMPAVGTKPPARKIGFEPHSCHVRKQEDLPPFRPRENRSRGR